MRNRGILDLEAVNAQNRPFLMSTDPLSLQRGSGVWKTRQQTQSEKTLVKTRAHARARCRFASAASARPRSADAIPFLSKFEFRDVFFYFYTIMYQVIPSNDEIQISSHNFWIPSRYLNFVNWIRRRYAERSLQLSFAWLNNEHFSFSLIVWHNTKQHAGINTIVTVSLSFGIISCERDRDSHQIHKHPTHPVL